MFEHEKDIAGFDTCPCCKGKYLIVTGKVTDGHFVNMKTECQTCFASWFAAYKAFGYFLLEEGTVKEAENG